MNSIRHGYYHQKGISLRMATNFCRNVLGLNPCHWNNLKAAVDMLEVNRMKY
jgi:hypothetical protein